MRTTLELEDELFKEILEITGAKNKTRAVNQALREYIRLKRKDRLLSLEGKLKIEENWERLREIENAEK